MYTIIWKDYKTFFPFHLEGLSLLASRALIAPPPLLSLSLWWLCRTPWISNFFYSLWHCIPSRPWSVHSSEVFIETFLTSVQLNRGTGEAPRIKQVDRRVFPLSHCQVHITHDSTNICLPCRRTSIIFIDIPVDQETWWLTKRLISPHEASRAFPSFCSSKLWERAFVLGFIPLRWQGGCHTSWYHRQILS